MGFPGLWSLVPVFPMFRSRLAKPRHLGGPWPPAYYTTPSQQSLFDRAIPFASLSCGGLWRYIRPTWRLGLMQDPDSPSRPTGPRACGNASVTDPSQHSLRRPPPGTTVTYTERGEMVIWIDGTSVSLGLPVLRCAKTV